MATGKILRTVEGQTYCWVKSWYDVEPLYNSAPKQLNSGKTGLQFKLSKSDATSAGISHCVMNAEGALQRTLLGFDKDGNEINLKTGNVDGVVSLAFGAKKLQVPEGCTREDVVAALKRFRFEIVEAQGQ